MPLRIRLIAVISLFALVALAVASCSAPGSPGSSNSSSSSGGSRGSAATPRSATQGPTSSPVSAPTAAQCASSGITASGKLKGIYQFTGTPQVNNPSLSGGVVIHYWRELEPADGQFNWAPLDQDIAQWTAAGKQVIIRVPFASSYDPTHSATPQWVYQLGVKQITEVDGSVHPQYWNPIFLEKLRAFIQAFGARYDGKPGITYINAAIGNDGETIVDGNGAHSHDGTNTTNRLQLWQGIGYSDPVWWQTIQTMFGDYLAAFHNTPLAVQVDQTFIGGSQGYNTQLVLGYAASHGIWLQSDGEYPGKPLNDPQWLATTLVLEPGENSQKQGATLAANLTNIANLGATYALVFGSDLKNASNQQALGCMAALTQRG